MKIIHCADIHLGAKIQSFPTEVAKKRREEVRNSFSRMVAYAKNEGVGVILLCGDVFDRDEPYKKDVDFFYDVVKSNPDILFFYLRGNHDLTGEARPLDNLKTFSTDWSRCEVEDIVISGIELVEENKRSFYSTLALEEGKKNIVMLHGQVGEEIPLAKLRDKNIDYLALGHIHEYTEGSLDKRGRYAYSGCLEGRGFDETGVKGFILLDTEKAAFNGEFIPFSKCEIAKITVDVSSLKEGYAMAQKVKAQVPLQKGNIYRVELTGEVDVDLDEFASDVEKYLCADCAYISVKDCTKKKIDYAAYAYDKSLRGEFVRAVADNPDFTEEERAQIIAYGLKALDGREVDA